MNRRRLATGALAAACALLVLQGSAEAAQVMVFEPGGRVVTRDDPFVSSIPEPGPPGMLFAPRARAARGLTGVAGALAHLRRIHAISSASYARYRRDFSAALSTIPHLRGTRAHELGAVVGIIRSITAAGMLTAKRLPALFLTLEENQRWWTRGPLLSPDQRIEFKGSQLVWQYYQGQGIQLQELGSFGKADGLYTAGRANYGKLHQLLSEIVPLAAKRAGGPTWEYYFAFDGGSPPWASAMAQGTAIEAFTRAYRAFGDRSWLSLAHRALPVLGAGAPTGVSVRTHRGLRFVLYSFDSSPRDQVINGFLQTLIGLYDYAHASGDRRAAALFAAGDAEARSEVPHYDTGSWSLYQPGVLDSVDYHNLVTGFLQELCDRVHARVYCRTAARFRSYASHPPPGV